MAESESRRPKEKHCQTSGWSDGGGKHARSSLGFTSDGGDAGEQFTGFLEQDASFIWGAQLRTLADLQPICRLGSFLLGDTNLVNEIVLGFSAVAFAIIRPNGTGRAQQLSPHLNPIYSPRKCADEFDGRDGKVPCPSFQFGLHGWFHPISAFQFPFPLFP